MKSWIVAIPLCFLVLPGCLKEVEEIKDEMQAQPKLYPNDSSTRVLNEMKRPATSQPVMAATEAPPLIPDDRDARIKTLEKARADLLEALTAERAKVARLQSNLDAMGAQGQRIGELEQKVKEQEEELAKLRPLQAELEDAKRRLQVLGAKLSDCQDELDRLRKELAEKPAPPPPPPIVKMQQDLLTLLQPEIKRGDITIFQAREAVTINLAATALFDSGSDVVHPEGIDILKRVGSVLKDAPDHRITVTGHTDNQRIKPALQKRFPTNRELSEARAVNGAKALREAGVEAERIHTLGKGESQPIASNTTEEGRAKNRRIEIVVLHKGS